MLNLILVEPSFFQKKHLNPKIGVWLYSKWPATKGCVWEWGLLPGYLGHPNDEMSHTRGSVENPVRVVENWWTQGFSISKSFDPLLTSGLRHSQIHTGVEKTSFISDISSFPMANNGHKTPIFPSNPITLVSKNHHLSVFISDISSFPMVPMAMKPYKTLIFARSITIFGRKKNTSPPGRTWHRMSVSASERWSNIGRQYTVRGLTTI